jgi:two-component system NtrC family sensor kinase
MWMRSLSVRLMAAVGGVVLLGVAAVALLNVRAARRELVEEVVRDASQFSDTVKRSTHYAMLQNRWEDAFQIMRTIGAQEGIERVRVFSKEGLILFSTEEREVRKVVDKQAEACYACHAAQAPLEHLDLPERSRIFAGPGGRILGLITPIYNERGCAGAGCHPPPEAKRVLGVLDISISLARVDREIAAIGRRAAWVAGATVALALALIGVLIRGNVARPVAALVAGTERVAAGNLEGIIPVRSRDELGALAASFNEMTAALARARAEVAGLVDTLEHRVAERTRELEAAQTRLIQSEKLASLGQLAASIAHEINNPLTGVLTYARLLARRLATDLPEGERRQAAQRQLALVERETERCCAIVRNLLEFARQREPKVEPADVNGVIEEALSLVGNRLSIQGIELDRRLEPLPEVPADAGQLRQVFVNILLNACEAMGGAGEIAVTSRASQAGDGVEVAIADTGPGISPENLARIFDPFFTTKEKGTGLGLSVAYGIVQRHGGRIDVRSRPGEGTTMTVWLPRTGPPQT